MADQWERTLSCQDAHGRPRDLRVYIGDDNSIGLQTPPGDAAQLKPDGVEQLNRLLAAAVVEATHRGAEWG